MPEKYEPAPEKYEQTPGKYDVPRTIVRVAFAAGAVGLIVFLWEPGEPAPDPCEGLTPLQCFEKRDLERRQQEFVRQLEEADMMP